MAINLRVVGIFYRTQVELPQGGTVKDVLIAAQNQITAGKSFSFNFTVQPNGMESPSSFRAFYESGFQSESSHRYYPGGEYVLTEYLDGSPYTVWQYYILDEAGASKNSKGFIRYDDPVDARVEDNETVIWRLVSVLNGPVDINQRLANSLRSKEKRA